MTALAGTYAPHACSISLQPIPHSKVTTMPALLPMAFHEGHCFEEYVQIHQTHAGAASPV